MQYTAFSDNAAALQGDYSGQTKFTLARSLVLVQASKGRPSSVVSIPVEAVGEGTDFGIRQLHASAAGALEVTKFGNSNLVSSLSLGGPSYNLRNPPLATSITLPLTPEAGLAVAIDAQTLLSPAQPGASTVAGVTQGEGGELAYSVAFAAVGADAIPTAVLDLKRTGNLYFYSACRQATLTFLNPPLAGQAYTLMVADPHFVETVAVAPGRTIASHCACGVDILVGQGMPNKEDNGLAQRSELARSLNGHWATHVVTDAPAALAALKPRQTPKPARRKARSALATEDTLPATAPAQLPPPSVNSPMHNAEIRLPVPRRRESFAF